LRETEKKAIKITHYLFHLCDVNALSSERMGVFYSNKKKKTDLDLKINNLIPLWISIFLNYICANLQEMKSTIQHIKDKTDKKAYTSYDLG